MTHPTPGEISHEIGVIGAGRLGSTLALALAQSGYAVTTVASASTASAEALAARLRGAIAADADELVRRCGLVVLAVPDPELAGLAARLAWRARQQVVHTSGALGLETLDPVRAAGGLRGCLHPLQAFPERFGDPARFAGIVCGIEADGTLGAWLEQLCSRLGAQSVRLEGVDRARYHAAAVLTSNYIVALHAAAAEAWTLAGLPAELARPALASLTRGALDAVQRLPLQAALTGPIARGDALTVEQHLRALAQTPGLHELYRQLGATLLRLPLAVSPEQRAALEALLSPPP
jgi:predicted short-subunit dehydrogenase-like oxidoreductase (DUF2520 family)